MWTFQEAWSNFPARDSPPPRPNLLPWLCARNGSSEGLSILVGLQEFTVLSSGLDPKQGSSFFIPLVIMLSMYCWRWSIKPWLEPFCHFEPLFTEKSTSQTVAWLSLSCVAWHLSTRMLTLPPPGFEPQFHDFPSTLVSKSLDLLWVSVVSSETWVQ